MTNAQMDFGHSILAAFREDTPAGGRPMTSVHGRILRVGVLLRHAALNPTSAKSRRIVREAARITALLLGPERARAIPVACDAGHPSRFDIFFLLGELCEDLGLIRVRHCIDEALAAIVPPDTLIAGRVLVRLSIDAIQMGRMDEGKMRVDAILASPLAERFLELRLRSLHNLSMLARTSGDLSARSMLETIIQEAGADFANQRARAMDVLGVLTMLGGDINGGIKLMWSAYELFDDRQSRPAKGVLANIAQALLDIGHPQMARAIFASLFNERLGMAVVLPMIGGYATASADLGDRDGVEWAVRQVMSIARSGVCPRDVAQTLLECSDSLAMIGEDARAGTLRRRGLRLASKYGYHDLLFTGHAPTLRTLCAPAKLDSSAQSIADRVLEMEATDRPHDLVYAG